MIQTIEIFYSFECPYSYLALDRLSQIENSFHVQVLWQPFSAKAAGHSFHNGSNISPERASYIREDATRLAKKMEIPIVVPSDWPENGFDPEKSARGAVVAGDLSVTLEYNVKMFQRWWAEGEDPNEQSFFVQLCDELDVDPNEFAGRISTHDTRERVKGLYKRGRRLQVFDTPMILIGEERFYGIDRISHAEDRLVEIGAKKPSWM
ncbi:MAG: DsbA family protein [Deltaproteobacteria bacterium]|nr:DsbA family protein [Deltaproteobacteria bacterium]